MRQQDWLETLDEPYKSQALKNQYTDPDYECADLQTALKCAFYFGDSPEGADYWINLLYKIAP